MLDHFSRSELACPTTDELRLATGFGEALEPLHVELDEPVYLSYAREAGCYSFWNGTTYFSKVRGTTFALRREGHDADTFTGSHPADGGGPGLAATSAGGVQASALVQG